MVLLNYLVVQMIQVFILSLILVNPAIQIPQEYLSIAITVELYLFRQEMDLVGNLGIF